MLKNRGRSQPVEPYPIAERLSTGQAQERAAPWGLAARKYPHLRDRMTATGLHARTDNPGCVREVAAGVAVEVSCTGGLMNISQMTEFSTKSRFPTPDVPQLPRPTSAFSAVPFCLRCRVRIS